MIDSICPHCFVTIGSSNCEADLEKMESAHVCDPALLSYYEQSEPLKKHSRQEEPSNTKGRNVA